MTEIRGMVERITYRDEATLYTVARFREEGKPGVTTVVGNFPAISVGEHLVLTGEWINHREYGRQFQVSQAQPMVPVSIAGIEKYLGSGLIKGIGPVTAQKLVAHFGVDTLEIIDQAPERLMEVEGIGKKKAQAIATAWQAQRDIHAIMAFLQGCGVKPSIAVKVYQRYGPDAIRIVKADPYRLASEVFGIGFKTADEIAASQGLVPTAPARLAAGLKYALTQSAGEGHTFLPRQELLQRAAAVLNVPEDSLDPVLDEQIQGGQLIQESLADAKEQMECVYLPAFCGAERMAAQRVVKLLRDVREQQLPLIGDLRQQIQEVEAQTGLTLAPGQRRAVEAALLGQVVVITGGPGTGKTTIVKVLLQMLEHQGQRCLLAAPTGRAAKRLSEATSRPAKTIHRLLEFGVSEGGTMGFQKNESDPLAADAVIVDEASMLDIILFNHLLKALQPGTKLVLVGDVDQLPPVGAGQVLKDLINSNSVVVARLTEVYRQAATSLIVTNAHRINQGEYPRLNQFDGDFFWIDAEDGERAADTIAELVTTRLPNYYGLDPMEDIQVLTPTRRSVIGTEALNQRLQGVINPLGPGQAQLQYGETSFRIKDKVMQLRNEYEKGVFNGDVGTVIALSEEEGELTVAFPDGDDLREVVYDRAELDQLSLSYAISVHKSQGSEYPAVVMPITFVAPTLRTRNLLYTAVTRAKGLVVLVGSQRALRSFIGNVDESRRYSGLDLRIKAAMLAE